jgi:hypothetical protein
VANTRVRLVDLRGLLRESVLALLAEDARIEIVGSGPADVVLMGPGRATDCTLLDPDGPRRVVILRDDGARAELLELVVHGLEPLTAGALREALHGGI